MIYFYVYPAALRGTNHPLFIGISDSLQEEIVHSFAFSSDIAMLSEYRNPNVSETPPVLPSSLEFHMIVSSVSVHFDTKKLIPQLHPQGIVISSLLLTPYRLLGAAVLQCNPALENPEQHDH